MESEFIDWLNTQLSQQSAEDCGIGDDCAVLPAASATAIQVISTDSIVDQVHFDTRIHTPAEIGHKALAVNLSDIAAMGATPSYAVVSLIIPNHWKLELVKELYLGILDLADTFRTQIVGGDFNRHAGPLTVSITILGNATSTELKYRSGTKYGDAIYVSGPLGGSIHGHHISFQPQIALGLELAKCLAVHAITDITDGLVIDLASLLTDALGAELNEDAIPLRDTIAKRSDAIHCALYDGEDFELLFTVAPEFELDFNSTAQPTSIQRIGTINDSGEITLVASDGQIRQLSKKGYQH
ncbi:MAG: thiamine-monophosphate kinase [Planctomycetaceae bacterium]|nr:thiamine-monophosphate kinase [Planctomycetaceae bacterium]